MNIPLEFFILVAGVIGTVIGILGTLIYTRSALVRKQKETWRRAEVFFTRRATNHFVR